MALVLADRVRDTTTTTGTGTVTLSGTAPTGYQNFSVIGDGNTTYYTINAGSQWEVGIGTYSSTGPTLSRDTVLESSNANALVDFAVGTKDVFVTYPSDKSVIQDGATIAAGTAVLGVANGGTGLSSTPANGTIDIGNGTGFTRATLTAGTNISITNGAGSITINATDQFVGTVTSVAASGGTTGLTFSGSPITTSGTLTLGGTLVVANGGTGATSLTSGYLLKGNGTSPVSASVIYDNGTNVGIGTSSPGSLLELSANLGPTVNLRRSGSADGNGVIQSIGNTGTVNAAITFGGGISNLMHFSTNGAERMRIDASGNVGIGITSVTPIFGTTVKVYNAGSGGTLEVGGATINARFFGSEGAGIAGVGTTTNTAFNFITNDTERMRITAAGGVAVGTTTDPGAGNIIAQGSAATTGVTPAGTQIVAHAGAPVAGNYGASVNFAQQWWSGAPASLVSVGQIAGVKENSDGSFGGGLAFFVAPSGSNNLSEAMRIGMAGNVTAYTDFRAPIFYDSANTAFYLDPTGSTSLNAAGSLIASGNLTLNNGADRRVRLGSSTNYFYDLQATGDDFQIIEAGTTPRLTISYPSGAVTAATDFRAPIFYDSNNTAYYVDAADKSVFNNVQGSNFFDGTGSYNVNLGSGGLEGRGLVAGYSGGSYGGIGYNVRHTPTGGTYIAPLADTANYITFNQGFTFQGAGVGAAGRTLSFSTLATLTNSAILTVTGDVRAPIFYDSNNTGFFTDPAGTSVLNALTISSSMSLPGGSAVFSNGDIVARRSSGATGVYYFVDASNKYLYWDGTRYYFGNAGPIDTDTSFRAPIFYDSNNTAYYVDPASGSNLNGTLVNNGGTTMTGGWNRNTMLTSTFPVLVFNSANTKYSGIGVDYSTATAGFRFWVNGTSADVTGTGTLAMNIHQGGAVEALGDFRAPIFYDSNNTARYLDPTATSLLTTVETYDGSGFRAFATPSASITSQIYFGNGNNTRAWNWQLDENNFAALWNYNGSAWSKRATINESGDLTMAGNVTAYSDARLKKDVVTIEGALDLVSKMRGVRYTRIDTENRNVGVIAQEMLEVLPEVVQQGVGENDTLSVAYGNLVGVLIEAIKELTARVVELEGK